MTRRRRARGRLLPWLLTPAVVVLAGFYVGPLGYNVVLSLHRVSLFDSGTTTGPWVGFANYAALVSDLKLEQVLGNSAFWLTAVTVLARLAFGIGLALLINATALRQLRLSGLARTLMIIPWAVPPVVAVVLWRFLLDPSSGAVNRVLIDVGLIDSPIAFFQQVTTVWPSVQAIIVWRELPFAVLMFLAGLQTIPSELYEAARIDRAGHWRTFWHITLPQLRAVTVAVTLLTTIWTFNNFIYVWLSTRGGPGTFTDVIGTAVYRAGFINYDIGQASALANVGTVTMFAVAVIYFLTVVRKAESSR
ncbi:carbohydrate ABC transporter permease [Microlunatus sp. GCM10028923]|uniref:carbohydrate ABC transporter permease n=1 Tax=Microlunatus sp. GCM10028923 TaxID=3273400 RepID=UPI00360B2FC3